MNFLASERYSRQILLPEIGEDGQEKLRRARVLLVGAGGLGSPVSLYLTGAGIGHLGLIVDDVVSRSNLHRQVLYDEAAIGEFKALEAARRLRALNDEVEIIPYTERLTEENAESILQDYDIVVDGCDNFTTRYILDDVTACLHRPYVYGAVCGFEGQVAVFNHPDAPCRYRELFPSPPLAEKSIIGMTPAVVGSVLSHEVIKIICGYGVSLAGRLWTIDLRNMQTFTLELK